MFLMAAVCWMTAIAGWQDLSPLPRLGSLAGTLTRTDLDEIALLVGPSGRRPWLSIVDEAFVPPPRQLHVFVYLEADAYGSSVRRGRFEVAVSQHGKWHIASSAGWAQVAVANRSFDEITGERDVNRPFQISDDFTDEEIWTLVTFLRTSPSNPAYQPSALSGRAMLATVKGDWPISRIRRRDDRVDVELLEQEHSGQSVTLVREGDAWKIKDIISGFLGNDRCRSAEAGAVREAGSWQLEAGSSQLSARG